MRRAGLFAWMAVSVALALVLGGCSLVFSSGRHTENRGTDGGGSAMDAGSRDAGSGPDSGPSVDSGPPDERDAGPAGLDAGAGPVPDVQFCQELVERYCRGRLTCCSSAGESFEQCVSQTFPDCNALLAAFLSDARSGYDPEVGREVVDEIDAFVDRSCDVGVVDWIRSVDGLFRVFRGTFPRGADCGDASLRFACQRPELCRREGVVAWRCGTLNAEGAACGSDLECETSLVCERELSVLRCQPRAALGEPCERELACESGVCGESGCEARSRDGVWCADPFRLSAFVE